MNAVEKNLFVICAGSINMGLKKNIYGHRAIKAYKHYAIPWVDSAQTVIIIQLLFYRIMQHDVYSLNATGYLWIAYGCDIPF